MKLKVAITSIVILMLYDVCISAVPDKTTLQGTVKDAATGETLPGAGIYIQDLKTGAFTDLNGDYLIKELPRKKIIIQVSLVGYKTILETVDLTSVTRKDFSLQIAVKEINEIVITGSSSAIEKKRSPAPVSIIPKSELLESSSTNIIDAIAGQPGISQVTTGSGISKPVIRGLGYNRVVVVHDGVRQEGQQWGDEHGIEIDDNSVDKIEILKGPASLSYGSDAIAGVINLITAPTLPRRPGKRIQHWAVSCLFPGCWVTP